RLLVERGDAIENSQSQVIDVDSGDVVRHLHGLLNPDWLDDGTVTGATINATGEIETARADIASGHLVAEGYIVERGPTSANRDTGKERTLVLFQNGPDATLYAFEPRAQQLGPEIVVDGYVSSAISATGHRIAVGTVRGVEI